MGLKSAGLLAAGVLSVISVAGACTETLDSSAGCPELCTDQAGRIQTVTIDPVVLDTTLSSLTGQGTETTMLLSNRGDTLDSRAVIRFDSIPDRYAPTVSDTTTVPITTVDSARLRFRVDTTGAKLPGPVTIDAYDVNTDAPDSVTTAVAALFTPARLIATQTYQAADIKDSVFLQIPGAAILARLGQPLRIGLRARSAAGSVQFRILSVESGLAEQLYFRVSPDTSKKAITLVPFSRTPADQSQISASLSDYTVLANAPSAGPADALSVGGLPGRRVYMRFNVPPFIADTAQIVRATLILTQRPNRSLDSGDTIRVVAHVGLAGKTVTDLARAGQITALGSVDTLKVIPADSGEKLVEIAQVVALWRSQKVDQTPRAIVLISTTEGTAPLQARFFSMEAAPALRPRLRISYSTRKSNGLP